MLPWLSSRAARRSLATAESRIPPPASSGLGCCRRQRPLGNSLLRLMLTRTSAGRVIIYDIRNRNLPENVPNVYFPQLSGHQCPCLFILLQNSYCKLRKSVLAQLRSATVFCSEWHLPSSYLLLITFLFQFVTISSLLSFLASTRIHFSCQ